MAIKTLVILGLLMSHAIASGQNLCKVYSHIPVDSLLKSFKYVFILDTVLHFDRKYRIEGVQTKDDTTLIRIIIQKGKVELPDLKLVSECFSRKVSLVNEKSFGALEPDVGLSLDESELLTKHEQLNNQCVKHIRNSGKVARIRRKMKKLERMELFKSMEAKFAINRKQLVVLYNFYVWDKWKLLTYLIIDKGNSGSTYFKVFTN